VPKLPTENSLPTLELALLALLSFPRRTRIVSYYTTIQIPEYAHPHRD